jgi:hypothetical protein
MVAKKDVPAEADVVVLAEPGPSVPVVNEPAEEALQLDPVTSEDGPVEDFQAERDVVRLAQFKRSYVHQVAARSHHCVNGRGAVSSQHLCSGTQCMAWRWVETDLEGFEEYGYCGLAGDPLQ